MRESRWLRVVALCAALQACGGGERAPGGDEDGSALSAAALAASFDPLACTLRRECTRWGELTSDPPVEASACAPLEGEVRPFAWHVLTGGGQVPCAFGSCRLLDAQLARDPGGGVLAMSRVELPSTMARGREVGLWFARYAADGARAGSALWDFAIPPPGIEVQRRASLVNDASGDVLLASARSLLPADALRPLTLAPIAGRKAPAVKPPRASTPPSRGELVALGPKGELLVASTHRLSDERIPDEELDWDSIFMPLYPQRAALTLHDGRGRVLWNRPWVSEDASTAIRAVHMGADGQITVRVAADRGPLHGSAIARLDRDGRVLWQRHVAEGSYEQQSAVDAQGNVYVLSTRWWDEIEATLERIDSSGHRTGFWSLTAVGFTFELNAGHGRVWLTSRTDVGLGSELWAFAFAPESTGCAGERYGWPGDFLDLFDGVLVLVEDESSGVYIANSRLVAKLGGTP